MKTTSLLGNLMGSKMSLLQIPSFNKVRLFSLVKAIKSNASVASRNYDFTELLLKVQTCARRDLFEGIFIQSIY